nr:MAG TPA: hypothetical protein [Myoviridae sp. ct6nn14]
MFLSFQLSWTSWASFASSRSRSLAAATPSIKPSKNSLPGSGNASNVAARRLPVSRSFSLIAITSA